MQHCPACNAIYPDGTSAFCPTDGISLINNASAEKPQPAPPQSRPNPMHGYLLAARIALWTSIPVILVGFVLGVIGHVKLGGLYKPGNTTVLIATLIVVLGLLILITALISRSVLRRYALEIDEMFSSHNLLAHWTYPPDASNKHRGGEAYISSNGAMLNGKYHMWHAAVSTLVSVAFEQGHPNQIRFNYRVGNNAVQGGRASLNVGVPVPPGREEEARRIVAFFNK